MQKVEVFAAVREKNNTGTLTGVTALHKLVYPIHKQFPMVGIC
jgi:hypothetical protein